MTRAPIRPVVALALTCALLAAVAGCSDDAADDGPAGPDTSAAAGAPAPEEVLAALADEVIVPAYRGLVDGLATLEQDISALCAAPAPAALEASRASWRAVDLAWSRTHAVDIGPAMDRRLMGSVGFEARPDAVNALLAGDTPLDPESLAGEGAAVRGISAVEVALFADGSEALVGADGARRCQYAHAATVLSAEASAEVLADWVDGYRDTFVAGVEGSPQSSVAALVNETTFALQEVDDQGLRSLVEAGSPDALPANRDDGPAGGRVAQLRGVLGGATSVLVGGAGGGLASLVADASDDTAERLRAAVDDATTTVAALPDGASDAFADADALSAAADAVAALKVLVGTEVASELGVTIGFSDADGDS